MKSIKPVSTGFSNNSGLYANAAEWKKHNGHIMAIATENGKAVPDVAECYERILAELKPRARVPDYVDVFVTRRVIAQIVKGR